MSLKSIAQANTSSGLVTIKIRIDLRTLTVWQSAEDMKNFRDSGFHSKAMINSAKLGFNRSHSWETDHIPNWQEAIAQLEQKHANYKVV